MTRKHSRKESRLELTPLGLEHFQTFSEALSRLCARNFLTSCGRLAALLVNGDGL